MTRVRAMTYNIYLGGRKGRALTDAVRLVDPDVLLVNESPKAPLIWRFHCRRLTRQWGMRFVTGGRPAGSNMISAGGGILVLDAGSVGIRQPLFQPRRGVAWAQLSREGRPLGVASCHLSLDRARRTAEVERVIAIADTLRGPVVIAGDLNEPPTGPSWRRLREAGFEDHGSRRWLTFPADRPEKRIDALLVRGPAQVVHHGDSGLPQAVMAAASDHRPVLLELDLKVD